MTPEPATYPGHRFSAAAPDGRRPVPPRPRQGLPDLAAGDLRPDRGVIHEEVSRAGKLRLAPDKLAMPARHILDAISYNQHELPSGYLRDTPEDDLASLREVERLLAEPMDLGVRDSLQERIAALRNAAEGWIETRAKRTSKASG